jgi:hypothetical protein
MMLPGVGCFDRRGADELRKYFHPLHDPLLEMTEMLM